MTTFKELFGTNGQATTCTLASLAASPTVGRESTAIDNSSTLYDDVLLSFVFEVGVVTGNKQILVYVYATVDGGTTYTGGATGSDASFTRLDPTVLRPLAVIPVPTASVIYRAGPFSVAAAFGGVLPEKWGYVVFNDSGVALSGTAGNNKAVFQGVSVQGV